MGGGYPELYAQQLADNKTLLQELKTAIDGGMPCFAECGGFMYLLEHYRDGDKLYSWVGALKGESAMTKKLTRFGYVHLTAQQDNLLCPAGGTINGHEFHYSESTNNGASFIAAKLPAAATGNARIQHRHFMPVIRTSTCGAILNLPAALLNNVQRMLLNSSRQTAEKGSLLR